ncbi:hypothetical protein [Schlesneria sp. T3-172]|uniref:hypothetical protein n=1 Tax=Schlesneria sphaerica TaxID=3373610 RepID=UPI0037CC4DC5
MSGAPADIGRYPARPAFFAMKFIRLLAKTCVAQEIGPTGFALLVTIATTEDAAGYRRAVTFFDGQLMPIVGVDSQKSLARARIKCVDAGWLNYEPGCRGRAGRYFVVIPPHASGIDDNPTDEGFDDSRRITRKKDVANGVESEYEADNTYFLRGNGDKVTGQRANILPIPIPNTEGGSKLKKTKPPKATKAAFDPLSAEIPASLDTPPFRQAFKAWADYRRDEKKPLTELSANLTLKKLAPHGASVAIEKIETAMANGWQGVAFESRGSVQRQNHSTTPRIVPLSEIRTNSLGGIIQ